LIGSGKDSEPKERELFLKSMSMPDGIASITVANSLGVTLKETLHLKSRPSSLE